MNDKNKFYIKPNGEISTLCLDCMKSKFESAEQANYQNLKTLIESKEVEE